MSFHWFHRFPFHWFHRCPWFRSFHEFFLKKMVLGPLDLFGHLLTFLEIFHCFISFIHWFMIDLPDLWLISPPRGVGFEPPTLWLRDPCATPLGYTRHSLQVVPKIPSGTQNTLFFEGSPFCRHEGRHKRWVFLNWCTFRFRSTPSFFFPTQQIGFGAGGRFWTFFDIFSDF